MDKTKSIVELTKSINQLVAVLLNKKGLSQSRLSKLTHVKNLNDAVVLSFPEYAKYVDSGRRAGKVPIKPILEWIKRNNIRAEGASQVGLAYAIANSISKKGIKARPFLDETYKLISKEVDSIIKNTKILS